MKKTLPPPVCALSCTLAPAFAYIHPRMPLTAADINALNAHNSTGESATGYLWSDSTSNNQRRVSSRK